MWYASFIRFQYLVVKPLINRYKSEGTFRVVQLRDILCRTYNTTLWTKITLNNELYSKIVMNFTLCFGGESCTLAIRTTYCGCYHHYVLALLAICSLLVSHRNPFI